MPDVALLNGNTVRYIFLRGFFLSSVEQTRAGEHRTKEMCVCVCNDVPLVVIRYVSFVMVRQELKSGWTNSITYAPQVIDLKPEHVPPSISPHPSSLDPNQNLSVHEQVVDTDYETWLKKKNESVLVSKY